jgi:rubrerythrin
VASIDTAGADLSRLTLRQALQYAISLEQDARDQYLALARSMKEYGESEAGEFFWRMAHLEEGHRVALETRRKAVVVAGEDDGSPSEGAPLHLHAWEGPLTDEAAMGLTLRAAIELSLAAEGRAHEFFVSALASIYDAEVHRLFLGLAEEELVHQAMLRKELEELVTL